MRLLLHLIIPVRFPFLLFPFPYPILLFPFSFFIFSLSFLRFIRLPLSSSFPSPHLFLSLIFFFFFTLPQRFLLLFPSQLAFPSLLPPLSSLLSLFIASSWLSSPASPSSSSFLISFSLPLSPFLNFTFSLFFSPSWRLISLLPSSSHY